MSDQVRVVVADDHPSVRMNLRYLIDAERDLTCVGAAKDGAEALRLCHELMPDVLVLDDDMPGAIGGLEIARALTRDVAGLHVVMYTLDADVCIESARFGAEACLTKDVAPDVLLRTIRETVNRPVHH